MKTTGIALAALALACASTIAAAQTAKDLVGTWKNVKNTSTTADGKTTDVFGAKGTGMAIFTADGHFAIVNLDPMTPKFAANARNKGTADENKAAVAGGIGLYGTYTVANKVLTLKTEGSTYPNWTGTEQKRDITKHGPKEFTWTLTNSLGGKGEVTWQRIK
jgi:lipocalin-like protein